MKRLLLFLLFIEFGCKSSEKNRTLAAQDSGLRIELSPFIIPDRHHVSGRMQSYLWLKVTLSSEKALLISDNFGFSANIVFSNKEKQEIGYGGDLLTVLDSSDTLQTILKNTDKEHFSNDLVYSSDTTSLTNNIIHKLQDSLQYAFKKRIAENKRFRIYKEYAEESASLQTDGILLISPKNSMQFMIGAGKFKPGIYKAYITYTPTLIAFELKDGQYDISVKYPDYFKGYKLIKQSIISDTISLSIPDRK